MLNILSNTMAIATGIDRTPTESSRPLNYVYSAEEKRQRAQLHKAAENTKPRRFFG